MTTNDGRVIRLGGDEPNAEMIPADLEFSTAIPGGYKDLSCSLLRRLSSDERLFNRVRAYGPGNRTAWDGRLVQFPREDLNVHPGAVGHAAHMRDDPSVREIYVDVDKSRWEGPSVQRQLNVSGTYSASYPPSLVADPTGGQAALKLALTGDYAARIPLSEAMYNAHGIPLGQLSYAWKIGPMIVPADTNWTWQAFLGVDDVFTAFDASGQLRAAGPGTGTLAATLTNRRVATVQLFYSLIPDSGHASIEFPLYWTTLAVYGNYSSNGIGAPVGTVTATAAPGYYGHSLIQNIVKRWAPRLTAAIGVGGVEENASFVVPQAAFLDPTTAEDAVMTINGYFLWEWGVYDDLRFFWRQPDPDRLVWRARRDLGARVSEEGPTADAQYNGVLVRFTDPTGQRKVAGPLAASWEGGVARCDVQNSTLADTAAANAVNAAGIPRRWGVLDVGPVTTDAGAVQLGYVWLQEHALPQRRGTITVSGMAEHPTEGPVPPWRVRAGDGVVVTDIAGDTPRRIIETHYSRRDDTITMAVGNTDWKVDAILERLGVQLSGVVG